MGGVPMDPRAGWGRGGRDFERQPPPPPMTNRGKPKPGLFVGGLPTEYTDAQLKELFIKFGSIAEAGLLPNKVRCIMCVPWREVASYSLARVPSESRAVRDVQSFRARLAGRCVRVLH